MEVLGGVAVSDERDQRGTPAQGGEDSYGSRQPPDAEEGLRREGGSRILQGHLAHKKTPTPLGVFL